MKYILQVRMDDGEVFFVLTDNVVEAMTILIRCYGGHMTKIVTVPESKASEIGYTTDSHRPLHNPDLSTDFRVR